MIGGGKTSAKSGARALTALLVAAFVFTVLGSVHFLWLRGQVAQSRSECDATLEGCAGKIRNEIDKIVISSCIMKELILDHCGGLEFFDEIVPDIYMSVLDESGVHLRNIAAAPGGVVEKVYPLEGNEGFVGFNMLDPARAGNGDAIKACESKRTILTNPFGLVQGGVGMGARTPVFLKDENGGSRFWGLATVTLDFQETYAALGLDSLAGQGYAYRLWYEGADGAPIVLGESAKSVADPVTVPVEASGLKWHISASPKAGWIDIPFNLTLVILELFASALAGWFAIVYARGLELRRINVETAAANAAKTAFLFNMSHDIRTPMNAIIGFTELMRRHLDDRAKAASDLDKISASSRYLLDLINEILEMSRIESGKATLEETLWDALEFNDSLMAVFEEQMAKKGIAFTRSAKVEHDKVFCDGVKLKEIFLNVLSNALKYTPAGGRVTMDLEEIPSTMPGYAMYHTVIRDTGIGMSKEFLPHVFDNFSRERTRAGAKDVGSGLGMPIVKRLVELMNGTISVESEPGVGTAVTITLPHRIATEDELKSIERNKPTVTAEAESFAGKRILLAEDNDLNAEIAIGFLSMAGFEIDRARDGAECVDRYERSAAGYYDLILMDVQMPIMDGYEATRMIRRTADRRKANIPIVAMTANAFAEDRAAAQAAGMDGHIAKPIDVAKMMATIGEVLRHRG